MPKPKKSKEKETDILKKIVLELMNLIGLETKMKITKDSQNQALNVNIDAGKEAGLIIGNRGRTLNSLQSILGMIYKRKTGEWKRIILDVGDWREKENERLFEIAASAAERAKQTDKPQTLYNLSSSQRRTVHLALSEDKEISTESFGEGKDRYLVITPKK